MSSTSDATTLTTPMLHMASTSSREQPLVLHSKRALLSMRSEGQCSSAQCERRASLALLIGGLPEEADAYLARGSRHLTLKRGRASHSSSMSSYTILCRLWYESYCRSSPCSPRGKVSLCL